MTSYRQTNRITVFQKLDSAAFAHIHVHIFFCTPPLPSSVKRQVSFRQKQFLLGTQWSAPEALTIASKTIKNYKEKNFS